MKKKEFIQIKGLDLTELTVKAQALKAEIADLTLDKNMKKLKDLKMVSKKRKERAQVLTVARGKELLIQLESQVQKDSESSESSLREASRKVSEPEDRKSGLSDSSDTSDTSDAKKGTKK